jgi:Uma2 family endonuclease
MSTNGKATSVSTIGPRDHGRRMSLRDFEFAEGKEGYRYELSRGVISVMNVPGVKHARRIDALRIQLAVYQAAEPEEIYLVASSMDAKLLSGEYESERHPDMSIYLDSPPRVADYWWKWIPAIVVEFVSRSSRKRDYQEKPEEYLSMGVKEYWIIDVDQGKITILQRSRGKWKETVLGRDNTYQTKLLPGFELNCRPIFEAAEKS